MITYLEMGHAIGNILLYIFLLVKYSPPSPLEKSAIVLIPYSIPPFASTVLSSRYSVGLITKPVF
jgi:hypothetical protein